MKAAQNFRYYLKAIWILGMLALFCTGSVFAEPAFPILTAPPRPPSPPAKNPHPPISRQDKARVAFAQKAVEILLKKKLPQGLKFQGVEESLPFQSKDLACLKKRACYEKDIPFVNELSLMMQTQGNVVAIKHPHIIPWSLQRFLENKLQNRTSENEAIVSNPGPIADQAPQEELILPRKPTMEGPRLLADEYMVHMYVQFKNTDSRWHHLDIILSEDEEGHVFLRHFYTTPMLYPKMHMPTGIVC